MTKPDRIGVAFAGFVTLIGLLVRIAVPLTSSFPLNDGGLFYAMILDLQNNHYLLPAVTTYNSYSIPFAYPPLAFYFYALLNSLTRLPLLDIVRLLPAVISGLTIPAFFLLATELLESRAQAALATLIFAFVPRAFDWLIMGGGITRSLGLLFALLAMRQAYILFSRRSLKDLLLMIGLGALVVYTHPEATIHTILTALLFFLWKDRSRKGLLYLAATALGVALLTAPWWAVILNRYGINPFLAASTAARQNSYNVLAGVFVLFRFDFADEPFVSLISALGVIGFFYLLAMRKFLLPLWLVVMHTFEPRGGPLFMMIPLAMYAGIALEQLILPPIRELDRRIAAARGRIEASPSNWLEELLMGRVTRIFTGFLFIYLAMSAYNVAFTIQQNFSLTQEDLQVFQWVKTNTPAGSQFALITSGLPLRDAESEWFPALAQRQSVATVFGFEWVNDGLFGKRTEEFRDLQACADQDPSCLEQWSRETGRNFSYVLVKASSGDITGIPAADFLANSGSYEKVYGSKEIEIFLKK